MPQSLDYEPAKVGRPVHGWASWGLFAAGWLCGTPLTGFLDSMWKRFLFGGPADGGATLLAMPAVVVAAVVIAIWRPRRRSVWFTVGLVSSPIAVTVMYLVAAL